VEEHLMTAGSLLLIPAIAVMASACAYSASGQSYPRHETRVAYDVEYGEVVSARAVEIEGDASLIGVLGGAEVGRAVGDTSITRAVGSVAGAVAGHAIERKITAEEGLEIIVRLDRDDTIAVVQAADVEFAPGERVRVLFGHFGEARVTPL
jgi:outer membrane lipoprotein SlyB